MKALGLTLVSGGEAQLPNDHLSGMSLRTLLLASQIIGKHRRWADGVTGAIDPKELVQAAAGVLADWPNNFYKLLHDSVKNGPPQSTAAKQFGPLLHSLSKNRTIASASEILFIRDALIHFAANHWGGGFVGQRLRRGASTVATDRFVTQSGLAKRLRIQPRTAARLIRNGAVPSSSIAGNGKARAIVDASSLPTVTSLAGKILRIRDVARRLEITPSLLAHLKNTGCFPVIYRAPNLPGFHEQDIEKFIGRLGALSPASHQGRSSVFPDADRAILLRSVLRGARYSLSHKEGVLASTLAGEIPVVGRFDDGPVGLMLDRAAVEACLHRTWERAGVVPVTFAEAAREIGCDKSSIRELIDSKYLCQFSIAGHPCVTAESLAHFRAEFLCLAEVAKAEHTSSRALMRRLTSCGVAIIRAGEVRKDGQQPFVRAADLRLFQRNKTCKAASAVVLPERFQPHC